MSRVSLLLAIYFFVFGNWFLSFTSPDEGKNASAAIGMLSNGDFLIPYYNCQPRFEKPPMLYWVALLLSLPLGFNEFSARLVSGLSAVGVSFFTYLIVRRELDEETARKSFLILLTFPHMWLEARAFVPEMLNTFFIIGSLYFFISHRVLLGWLFLAFAFLTKGPVGVVLTLGVYLLWKRDLKILSVKGVLLFLLLSSSWYLYMLWHFGYTYFYKFFLYENIMRYTGQSRIHPYPFYYYLPILLVATIFYVPKYVSLFRSFKRELLPYILWAVYVLLFYSLAKNKLHHYILFAYPPLSVIFAHYTSERYIKRVLMLSSLLILFLSLSLIFYEKERFVPKASSTIASYRGEVYFYRVEDSALVYYSGRCIEKTEDAKENGLIITKSQHVKDFSRCSVLLEGLEFDRRYALLDCGLPR